MDEIIVNGIKYVPESNAQQAEQVDGMDYVIIRADRAGVFAGYLKKKSKDSKVVELINSRRIWYWDGASSISELAVHGTSKPDNCKFPCEVPHIEVSGVCEIIECTEKAKKSIQSVIIWTQNE